MYNMRRRGHNEGHMFVPKVLTLYHPKTGKKSSIEGTFTNYVESNGGNRGSSNINVTR